MLTSLKPEFLRDFEHIPVKGTNANFAPAIFFAYVKGCGYVNCIQTFAFRQNIIVIGYRIFKIFSNIYVENIPQKLIELLQPGFKAFIIKNTFLLFNASSQRNVHFKFKQDRTYSNFVALPNCQSLFRTGFVQQDREQKRRIKIGYKHKSKSVGSFCFVKSLKFFSCHFWLRIKPFRSFHRLRRPFRQTRPASFGFLNHPLNKTGFFLAFHGEHHPIAEVYKPVARLGGFRFFNSSRLHSKNIEKFSEFLHSTLKTETTQ